MNRLTIIGNLTRAPEVRTAADGNTVTVFTVAVNRGDRNGHPMADYVRVSAWNKLGENCGRYLDKGKKGLRYRAGTRVRLPGAGRHAPGKPGNDGEGGRVFNTQRGNGGKQRARRGKWRRVYGSGDGQLPLLITAMACQAFRGMLH